MSLEQDITQVKKILEEEDIFIPASREEVKTRRAEPRKINPNDFIGVSNRKMCQLCTRIMAKGEKYLYIQVRNAFRSPGICKLCIKQINDELNYNK